jgi:ankyrin repeat protein
MLSVYKEQSFHKGKTVQRDFSFTRLTKPDAKTIDFPLNAEGNTYLHELCFNKASAEQVREAVVSLGANVQALNRKGLPPLGLAIIDGNLELIQCLIDCGAELCFPIGNGEFFNATATAVFWGREDVLALILKNGGGLYVNQVGSDLSCLCLAVEKNRPQMIEPLAAAGAFVDQESGTAGRTALQRAALGGFPDTVEKLVKLGAKIDKPQSSNGMTALHYAAADGNRRNVERLLKLGANANALTAEGLTPLMLGVNEGNADIIALLAAARADVNYRCAIESKETALHRAATKGDYDAVSALLKNGADPLLADAFNRTAARRARETGHLNVAAKLEEAELKAEQELFEKAYNRLRR